MKPQPFEEEVRDWEEEFDLIAPYKINGRDTSKYVEVLKNFIRSIIHRTRAEVRGEERQFILNILDGIDIADKEMGNSGGGTKAIRLALASRSLGEDSKIV